MKKVTRYEIRYYPPFPAFSKTVGFKGRLVEYHSACRIVKRLRKSGIDAFKDRWLLNAKHC